MKPTRPVAVALLVVVSACGGKPRVQAPEPEAPRASAPPAKPATPRARAAPTPVPSGKSYPECDPRWRDPDRGRVALGLLAGDCEDERGRNAVYVTRLVPIGGGASPAQQAGVQVGDRIVRLDTCEVPSTHALARQLRTAVPGWVARMVVERSGREQELFVSTIKLPDRAEPLGTPHLSTAGCQALGRQPAKDPA